MPFSKTPIQSSFQTKPIPLLYEWETRDVSNNCDNDSVNTINELVANNGDPYFNVAKRDGLIPLGLPITGTVLGVFAPSVGAPSFTQLVIVTSTNTYQCTSFNGVWSISFTAPLALNPLIPYIGFTEFLFQNGTTRLYFSTGLALYEVQYGGPTVTLIAGVPTPPGGQSMNPYPVFLDGYLFLCDTAGNIYNCALNDPTTWPASNVATAESFPDPLRAIARAGSYLIALGTSSIEWFYDAGNPTGTPLQVYVGATRHVGYIGGVVERSDTILFVGTGEGGQAGVYQVTGLKLELIASFPYSRWASTLRLNAVALNAAIGAVVGLNGHDVYFFDTYSTSDTPNFRSTLTYGLDLDNKTFNRFIFQASTRFVPQQGARVRTDTGLLPLVLMTFVNAGVVTRTIYQTSANAYQDDGVNFPVQFTTRNLDFGTRRNKFGGRFLLDVDQTGTPSSVAISWSVDDYSTFSTPRNVDVGGVYPVLYSIGMFKKIAFRLTYSDNFPMRFRTVEFDYDQGSA